MSDVPVTPVPVTLRVGTGLRAGESRALAEAAAALADGATGKMAVIIEGGPGTFTEPPGVTLVQLAAGCVCCVGQLPLRVTLARLLRQVRPARVWIEIASDAHLPALRKQLNGPGFNTAIRLSDQ